MTLLDAPLDVQFHLIEIDLPNAVAGEDDCKELISWNTLNTEHDRIWHLYVGEYGLLCLLIRWYMSRFEYTLPICVHGTVTLLPVVEGLQFR